MTCRRLAIVLAGAGLLAFQGVARGDGQPVPRPDAFARPGERVRIIATDSPAASVVGFAWTASNEPLRDVEVRLRDLLSGTVAARVRTTDTGEFLFRDVEGGSYVVEIADERGRVVALGAPFRLASGETIATFVRLALAAPSYGAVLSNTAAAAVFAAAGLGIAAVEKPAQPASADR